VEANNKREINEMFGDGTPEEEIEERAPSGTSDEPNGEREASEPPVIDGGTTSFGFADKKEYKKARAAARRRGTASKIAAFVMFLIGIAAGIIICYVYFFGLNPDSEPLAVSKAADAVMTELGLERHEVIFTDIYVKNKINEYEFIIYCAAENDAGGYDDRAFRAVAKKNSDEVAVYDEYSQKEYERLMAGSNQDKVKAGLMKSYKTEFDRCISEIRNGDGGWFKTRHSFLDYINNKKAAKED
jgi:hypothetical protein